MQSDYEDLLWFQITRGTALPPPVRQFRFNPARRSKADFAWVPDRLIVEVDGGTWVRGRHNRGAGYTADRERDNWCCLHG